MNNDRRVPGPVLIGIESTGLTDEERDWLQHPAVGGVVLFRRNYSGLQQLSELNQSIREQATAPMLICVDHEGGRVQRFHDGFTRLPPLAVLGRLYEDAPDKACDFAYRHGRVMATEVLLSSMDLSFAPVLDIDVQSCVIGDRAFSSEADVVLHLAGHYLAGMHDAGMKTCGKHFPGHGSVHADSHTDEVVDERPFSDIEQADLRPFTGSLGQLDSLMMAHVIYPAFDAVPAGYSSAWIRQYLRGELGYDGVVFSDDLGMHAAGFAGNLHGRLALSLQAGCDAVLVCQPPDVRVLLNSLRGETLAPCPQLQRLAGHNTHGRDELATVGEWRHWQSSLQELEKTKWA